MIKPSEIIDKVRMKRDFSIKYETEVGLGRGGFKCRFWKSMGVYEGHDCTFIVEGKHVHSFGPVKNWVECCIKVSFYPTENEGKYNNDGYSYECLYKSYFWGSYYTTDFDALLNRLLDAMIDYFDYHESSHYSEKDGETMRLGFYKNQRAGSVYL